MSLIEFDEHPDYKANQGNWQKYQDLYDGDHGTLSSNSSYLWWHELEKRANGGAQLREIRELRSRYLNLMEPVVSRWISFLFRDDMDIPDDVRALLGDEGLADITGTGVGFETFCKDQIALNYVLFGKPIVYVDSFGTKAESVGQARALGLRPFMEILSPLEVKDWQISSDPARKGKYDFLRCEYDLIEPRTSATQKAEVGRYSKVLAVVDGVYTISTYKAEKGDSSVEWKLVEEPVTIPQLTEIPVSGIEGGVSLISDASEQQLALFNLMSAESSILNASAFQRIFVIGVSSEKAKLAFNEYVANFLPEGASVQAIEPANTQPITDAINATIDRLFKVAFNQVRAIAADSKESPSAEAQREMKEDFLSLIKSIISEIEDIINQALVFYAKFKGIDNFQGKIQLDKNISIEDLDAELAVFAAMKDDFKKVPSAYKAFVKKRISGLNLEDPDNQIDAEIESADFSAAPESQNMNGGLKAKLLEQVTGNVGGQPANEPA